MKTKIIFAVLLVLSIIIFYMSKPDAKENEKQSVSGTNPSKFRIGLVDVGRQRDFNFLSVLNFNLWHKYMRDSISPAGKYIPKGFGDIGALGDVLENNISQYQTDVTGILNANTQNGYKSYICRPKIEMLTFAQRSDYQCEYIQENQNNEDWWYAFDYSDYGTNNCIQDSNVTVRHLSLIPDANDPPGYIVKQLRANREQVGVGSPGGLYWDGNYSWYIKPRMRIDSAFANNPANWTKEVCRIDVINYDGDTIRKVNLTVFQFLNNVSNFYNGCYKEDGFRFDNGPNKLLIERGDTLNPNKKSDNSCKFDIQVYWSAECELWIDYVRVENDWADRLFKDYYVNPIYNSQWIAWEADQIASTSTTYNFYTDESEYNFMPAIKYLNEKIHQYKPSLSLNSIANINFHTPSLRNGERPKIPAEQIRSNIQKWGMNEVMVDIYPLLGNVISQKWISKWQTLPNTLGNISYNPAIGILGVPVAPAIYEENLDSLMTYFYIQDIKNAREVAVPLSLPLHIMMQNHLWYGYSDTNYSQREPTNQELDLMANLAISYNAKALSQFAYTSWGNMSSTSIYSRGLLGYGTDTASENSKVKRTYNAYGQNKWAQVCNMNAKFKNGGIIL